MPQRQKRYTRAQLLLRAAGLLLGVMLLGFLAAGAALAAWHMYGKLQEATAASDGATSQLALLTAQDTQVKSDISDLSTSRGVEAALRERYGVIKPGEGVIQVVEAPPTATSSDTSASQNIFQRLWHVLTDL
ncbi:MAG: hypothetical protein KGJ34_01670 [Patescibacteria group bacterium]|nr:hypothetical protein [Patescibacteria group bacterium]